ncbi:MAG: ATPase [Oscillospiraceae bacterium]|jgi:V/A-type H+-transporting ATPase subunit K|nr:ATPase [Oscillospiraceae bacterium]
MSVYEILEIILLPLLIVAMLFLPVYAAITKKKDGKTLRRAMITNICAFGAVMLAAVALPIGGFVSADTAQAAASGSAQGLGFLSAALSVGVACIGCGMAVGNAATAAIGALAEDAKSFSKALIFVALGEGVGIYGVLIAIMIINKL